MTPFDYLNSINDTKIDIMKDDIDERAYNSFVINRTLSYFPDTVALANELIGITTWIKSYNITSL